jgi:hypothetical protein
VFFGRMVPLVRSMISVPAGVERMNIALFLALTAAGSLIWNSLFVLAGYFLGENWHIVEGYAGILSKVVLAAIAIAVVVFVVRRIRGRRKVAPAVVDDAPTVRIPVAAASGAHRPAAQRPPVSRPAPQWSAQPSTTEWSAQPTQRIPMVRPYAPPPRGPHR